MTQRSQSVDDLTRENDSLLARLEEAQNILSAIRTGGVDALIVDSPNGEQVFTLQGADHPYRTFVETMNEGAVTLAMDGSIVYCNQVFADWVGQPLERTLGSQLRRFVTPTDLAQFDELMSNSDHQRAEITLHYADGNPIPVHLSARRMHLNAEEFVCLVATDLRERKRHEQLLESERKFRQLMDALPAAVYTTDAKGILTHYNEGAVDLWGYRPELGSSQWCGSWRLFRPDGTPLPHDQFPMALALKENRAIRGMEAIAERPDGSRVPFIPYPTPIRDAAGVVIGGVNMLVDITDRKRAEERLRLWSADLEQAVDQRTKELLESRERLRALATELNLAEQRERKRVASELHDYLAQLLVLAKMKLGQGRRLAESVPACAAYIKQSEDVLTEALIYTRTLVADLSPPVLRDFGLPTALKWLSEQMQRHQLTVTVHISEGDYPKLPEDQALLMFQSVRELLINASKYGGSGEATVSLTQCNGELRIEVCDRGQGFDMSEKAATVTEKFGLFSIRERMQALGGTFELDSAVGEGTRAMLVLPIHGDGASRSELANLNSFSELPETTVSHQASDEPQNSTLKTNGTIRVLLVDDHAMVRQGLRSVLDSYADIEVVGEAANGEEAIAGVITHRPAVVVMDINMPKLNGIDATSRIKSHYPKTIVIGLSVQTGGAMQQAMLRAGAAGLLTKEAAVDQLYQTIQAAYQEAGEEK